MSCPAYAIARVLLQAALDHLRSQQSGCHDHEEQKPSDSNGSLGTSTDIPGRDGDAPHTRWREDLNLRKAEEPMSNDGENDA